MSSYGSAGVSNGTGMGGDRLYGGFWHSHHPPGIQVCTDGPSNEPPLGESTIARIFVHPLLPCAPDMQAGRKASDCRCGISRSVDFIGNFSATSARPRLCVLSWLSSHAQHTCLTMASNPLRPASHEVTPKNAVCVQVTGTARMWPP